VLTECSGAWSAREVLDVLELDGVDSGAYATERCRACVDIVAASDGESTFSGEGG
jgi:hypothetical protein